MTRSVTAATVLIVGLLAVVGGAPAQSASDPFDALGVERTGVPFPAPDVAFVSLDGREVRLRELRGQVVLLGFFTTT